MKKLIYIQMSNKIPKVVTTKRIFVMTTKTTLGPFLLKQQCLSV